MPPMFSREPPPTAFPPIVDADVVDETGGPVSAEETVPAVSAEETVQAVFTEETVQAVSTEDTVQAVSTEDTVQAVSTEETVQGVPVLAEVRAIAPHSPASLPAVQAAAVAATSFVAGAATLALVRRHTARKLARRQPRRVVDALPIVGSRSFLVDVHLIARDTGGQ